MNDHESLPPGRLHPIDAMSNTDHEMPGEETAASPPDLSVSNTDRLLQHLKAGTLAFQLVQAHKTAEDPLKGLKGVLSERLEQVRQNLGGAKN